MRVLGAFVMYAKASAHGKSFPFPNCFVYAGKCLHNFSYSLILISWFACVLCFFVEHAMTGILGCKTRQAAGKGGDGGTNFLNVALYVRFPPFLWPPCLLCLPRVGWCRNLLIG